MSGSVADFRGTDRYVIRRRIGAGGMGVVYDAFDKQRGERIALKTLAYAEPAAIYRLKKEFRALADVSHPNLVTLYELFAENDDWFITMELIEGGSFLDYARPEGQLDEARLRSALQQLAQGVFALHAGGHVHRDLKPQNVLVTTAGRVVILDFGISIELLPRERDMTRETRVIGTFAYMAPEQAAGTTGGTPIDWYSIGVMLYESLTGRLPFEGMSLHMMKEKMTVSPRSPDSIVPGLPRDLVDICMALLARRPEDRLGGEALLRRLGIADPTRSLAAHAAKRSLQLVGRAQQLAVLADAFAHTRAGQPAAVYVHGASGTGKSTLVQSFLDNVVQKSGAVVLTGRCFDRESMPYKAIDGVVDSLTRHLRNLLPAQVAVLLPRDVLAIGRIFPALTRVDAVAAAPYAGPDSPEPVEMRRRAFAALRELLARLADRQALVVHIDDLQWADADSMKLLEDLLRPPDAPPMLLIASFRSEEIASKRFLATLVERPDTAASRVVALGPLAEADARALAAELLETSEKDPNVEALAQESGGNPFFLEQLAQHLKDSETTVDTGATLLDMLEARIRRLPEGTRALLDTLAVAGHPLEPDVVFRAAGLQGDKHSLLSTLRVAHLIRPTGTGDRFELYHDRIREALTARLDESSRRWIHVNLAETIAAGTADPEALFEHYVGSGERERAAVHAVRAAQRAFGALAFDRAARFYRHALELGDAVGAARSQLLASLGDALANAGRPGDAGEAYLAAAPGAEPRRALEYRRRAGEQFLIGGHRDRGLQVLRDLVASLGLRMPAGPRSALLSLLLRRVVIEWRGMTWTERPADQIPERELLRMDVCWTCAVGLTLIDYIVAADFQARYLQMALRAGEPYRVARALAIETGFAAAKGGRSRVKTDRLVAQTEVLAERLQSPRERGLAKVTAGSAAFLRGEWRRAAELCAQAETVLTEQCTGVLWEITTSRTFLMSSLVYLGDLAKMRTRFQEMLTTSQERGDLLLATEMETRLNIGWLISDEPTIARQHVAAAIDRWSASGFHRQHYNALLALANIELYEGDPAAASRRVEEKWNVLQRSLLPRIQLLRAEAMFLRARTALAYGKVLLARGEIAEGKRLWKRCEQIADRVAKEEMPWCDPFAPYIRGTIAAQRGDRDDAVAHLKVAAGLYADADMLLLAAATRRRIGELQPGEAGASLVDQANTVIRDQKIADVDRMMAVLAPGFA